MRTTSILFSLLLFTVPFCGCDRSTTEKTDTSATDNAVRDVVRDAARSLADSAASVELPKTFDDETYGLHLRYPGDWVERRQVPQQGDGAGSLFRVDHVHGDVVEAMIFVNVHPPDESLFRMSEDDMRTYVQAGANRPEEIRFEHTHFDGENCLATRFVDTHDDARGVQRIVMQMYEFHHAGRRFSVHFAVSEEAAERYAPVFEAVLASFRLD